MRCERYARDMSYDISFLPIAFVNADNAIMFSIGDCVGPWRRKYTLLAENVSQLESCDL